MLFHAVNLMPDKSQRCLINPADGVHTCLPGVHMTPGSGACPDLFDWGAQVGR